MSGRTYDKAKWHYGGKWPVGLPEAQSFVHTGMYVGWLINRGLISDFFANSLPDTLRDFQARRLSAPKLFEACDGVFDDEMASPTGREFTEAYFDLDDGPFIDEYAALLARGLPTPYHVADTWENFDRLRAHLDKRFAEWRSRRA